MRVLVATSHRGVVGGIETYLRELLPALRERGHELALVYEHPAAKGQAAIDSELSGSPAWLAGSGEYTEALRQIETWRPQVVYLHGLGDPALENAFLTRFPTVLCAHGYHGTCLSGSKRYGAFPIRPCARCLGPACLALYYPRRCGGLNPITMLRLYRLQQRRRALLQRYKAVLVASAHMREEYRRHGVGENQLHLVPYFPPGQVSDPAPPPPRPVQGRVLMVGRLTDLKGGRFLVEAAQRAGIALGSALQLIVVGDGPERTSLEALARTKGVRAEFVGWVDGARRTALMREADLLAVPSVWPEPFGLVGIEAGCVGLPAVGFAVGGIPDWLIQGMSGELAPGDPPTVDGLAAALGRALGSPSHLARLGRGAWEVAQRFTRTAHLDALETIFAGSTRGGTSCSVRIFPEAP